MIFRVRNEQLEATNHTILLHDGYNRTRFSVGCTLEIETHPFLHPVDRVGFLRPSWRICVRLVIKISGCRRDDGFLHFIVR